MNRRGFLGLLLKTSVIAVACASVVGKTALYENPHKTISNIVNVYSVDDLPTLIDGVIKLEENTTYMIKSVIDLGKNRFLLSSNTRIKGNSKQNNLTYTGMGALFNAT